MTDKPGVFARLLFGVDMVEDVSESWGYMQDHLVSNLRQLEPTVQLGEIWWTCRPERLGRVLLQGSTVEDWPIEAPG